MRTNKNKTDVDTAKTITHISLCSGYGGIDLGLKRCLPTLRTILACEIEAYAVAQLVSKMEAGQMDACPVWSDLKTCDWGLYRDRVDILSGGYPCQPFSAAGRRKGKEDPRHLWPFIQRAIAVIRPGFCFFENVEGHLTIGFKDVCHDLGELGYELTAGIFSAAEVGAPHQRKRIFILAQLADADLTGWEGRESGSPKQERGKGLRSDVTPTHSSDEPAEVLAHPDSGRGREDFKQTELRAVSIIKSSRSAWLRGRQGETPQGSEGFSQRFPARPGEEQYEWEHSRTISRRLGGSTHGTSCRMDATANRVDRLRLLGNGVVPAVAEKAFRILKNQLREQTIKENE